MMICSNVSTHSTAITDRGSKMPCYTACDATVSMAKLAFQTVKKTAAYIRKIYRIKHLFNFNVEHIS